MRIAAVTLLEWCLALALLALWSAVAHAEARERQDAEAVLARHGADLRASCGASIRVEVDWKSFERALADSYTHETAAVYCGEVVRAAVEACASEPRRAVVRRSVKALTCRFGKPAAGTLDLRRAPNGAVEATFDWEGLGLYEDAQAAWESLAPPKRPTS